MIRLTISAAAIALSLTASAASAQQQTIEQLEQRSWPSISVGQSLSGSLTSSSTLRDDNTYADVYTYNAQAGETVTFTMRSGDVDSWLVVDEANGPLYQYDDDSGGGHDAQLTITFPRAGTYLVFANTVEPKAVGSYSFSASRGASSTASNSSSSSPAASGSGWAAEAQRLINGITATMTQRGYSLADFVHDGNLAASGSEKIPIHLSAGTSQVIGMCDDDCKDMDLELLDSSGKVVDSDLEDDDFPIVGIGQSGDYSVLVKMVKCNSSTCNYQLRIWAK